MAKHVPGAHAGMIGDHGPVRIEKRDVDGTPHKEGVDRGAMRKDDRRMPTRTTRVTAAGKGAALVGNDAPQPLPKRTGHHQAVQVPPARKELLDHGTAGANLRIPAGNGMPCHTTTPGRHGSTVTLFSCTSLNGAPSETPAIDRPDGQGAYSMRHV